MQHFILSLFLLLSVSFSLPLPSYGGGNYLHFFVVPGKIGPTHAPSKTKVVLYRNLTRHNLSLLLSCPIKDLNFVHYRRHYKNLYLEANDKKMDVKVIGIRYHCHAKYIGFSETVVPSSDYFPHFFDALLVRNLVLDCFRYFKRKSSFPDIKNFFNKMQDLLYSKALSEIKIPSARIQPLIDESYFNIPAQLRLAYKPTTIRQQMFSLRREYSIIFEVMANATSREHAIASLKKLYEKFMTRKNFFKSVISSRIIDVNPPSGSISSPLRRPIPSKEPSKKSPTPPSSRSFSDWITSFSFLFTIFGIILFFLPALILVALSLFNERYRSILRINRALFAQLSSLFPSENFDITFAAFVERYSKELYHLEGSKINILNLNSFQYPPWKIFSLPSYIMKRYKATAYWLRVILSKEEARQEELVRCDQPAPFQRLSRDCEMLESTKNEEHPDYAWACKQTFAFELPLDVLLSDAVLAELRKEADALLPSLYAYQEERRMKQARESERQLAATELEILLARTKALLKKTPYSSQSAIQNTFKELCGVLDGDEKPQRKLKRLKHFRSKEGLA